MTSEARTKVVVYGGGRLGLQVARVARQYFENQLALVGIVDDSLTEPQAELFAPLLGSLEDCARDQEVGPERVKMLFAIGYSDLRGRTRALERALAAGYSLHTLIHPRAIVDPSTELAPGNIVMAGAIVDQGVCLGEANYIDIGVSIGEDCKLGKANYLANRATLGGCVEMGHGNFIGLGATLVDHIQLGDHNFVNAASLLYRNVASDLRVIEVREQRKMRH